MSNSIIAESKASPSSWMPTREMALKVALWYAAAGTLWILFSGQALHCLVKDLELQHLLENLKGWSFILVTASLLALALDRYFREIRRSAQLLQASEERWQFALRGAGQGVWDWNAQTNEVFRSPGWANLLGIDPQEMDDSLAAWEARIHPEDLAGVRAELQRHLEGQTPMYYSEHRVRCEDGSYKWVVGQGRVMSRTADGKPLRVVGIYSDISERKRAETRLARLNNCLLSFGPEPEENISRLVALLGEQLGAACALYNRLEGDQLRALGRWKTPPDFCPVDKPEGHICYDVIQRGNGEARIIRNLPESSYAKSDPNVARYGLKTYVGKAVSCEGVNVGSLCVVYQDDRVPGPDDLNLLGIAASAVGVEERRRRAKGVLQESLLFRREAEKIGRVGAWKVNPKTDYVYWTEGVYELVEAPPDYKPGLEAGMRFYDAECVPALREGLNRALADGTPFVVEAGLTTLKGKHIWTEVRGLGRIGEDEQACVMGTFHDITERKRMESQLRQSQKLEAIGQLAGGVAHDFNNILAVIMMHLGLLQMNPDLDAKTCQALKDLDAAARRAASLTRQLLMFSRRSVLAVKPLDLNEVVENLLKMLRRLIGEHIDLRFDGKTALPLVEADAGMLEQVLMNLAVNARDAMPRGGRITISTTVAELTAAQAEAHPSRRPGRFVCLAMLDTGCGMDAATLRRIFEPFFTTKEAGKGTGLGLATVDGIVAQHKGWVEVDSEAGAGTTFRVYLPASAQAAQEATPAPLVRPVPRGRETVLVVEDEPVVREMVAESLRALGYRVREAGSGQQAMTLWQAHAGQVDLVLTDMVMPEGMTGLELVEQLQAVKPGLKAVIVSGYSAEIVQAGVPTKAGVTYLPKPFATKVLADVVRDCLDQRNRR